MRDKPTPMNRLLFGDNLEWLARKDFFPDESVDLVYLDPPFNSNADYNVLFKEESGEASPAQFHAFTDTWNWADAAETYHRFLDASPSAATSELLEALRTILGNSPMMAYLAMMTPRLVELRRVLKPTASLYLHCDPTASHYLKVILDGLFGSENFRNEIVWRRSHPKGHASTRFARNHDVILAYAKDRSKATWNPMYLAHDPEKAEKQYRSVDPDGRRYQLTSLLNPNQNRPNLTYEFLGVTKVWRWTKERMQQAHDDGRIVVPKDGKGIPRYKRYLDEQEGVPVGDFWDDIDFVSGAERLGYPTQKPQALLERIIQASSNPGDLVLDPFCGCGTSIHAAQALKRKWIGIDITYLAVNLIKRRLHDAFGKRIKYEERGQPEDIGSAKRLAEIDKFQFQHWALSLVEARPLREGSGKGADRGVDGLLHFYDGRDARQKLIVQVKGGGVKRGDVATLLGDVANQKAAGGVLVTLESPTKAMREEAADAGRFAAKLYGRDYPKIQILTIEGLLDGSEKLDAPPQANPFAKARREIEEAGEQVDAFGNGDGELAEDGD